MGIGVSDTDSFIDEVTEEVRRDQLYQSLRKYGWIAVVVVLLIVGTSAYFEWQRVSNTNEARQTGDAILSALENDQADARVAALVAIDSDSADVQALVSLIAAHEAKLSDDTATALAMLEKVAGNPDAPIEYRQLAELKSLLVGANVLSAEDRIAAFEGMSAPGQPYRMIALEQLALIAVEQGRVEDAVTILEDIRIDAEASSGLRTRAVQLIVALGSEPKEIGDFTLSSGN